MFTGALSINGPFPHLAEFTPNIFTPNIGTSMEPNSNPVRTQKLTLLEGMGFFTTSKQDVQPLGVLPGSGSLRGSGLCRKCHDPMAHGHMISAKTSKFMEVKLLS